MSAEEVTDPFRYLETGIDVAQQRLRYQGLMFHESRHVGTNFANTGLNLQPQGWTPDKHA